MRTRPRASCRASTPTARNTKTFAPPLKDEALHENSVERQLSVEADGRDQRARGGTDCRTSCGAGREEDVRCSKCEASSSLGSARVHGEVEAFNPGMLMVRLCGPSNLRRAFRLRKSCAGFVLKNTDLPVSDACTRRSFKHMKKKSKKRRRSNARTMGNTASIHQRVSGRKHRAPTALPAYIGRHTSCTLLDTECPKRLRRWQSC